LHALLQQSGGESWLPVAVFHLFTLFFANRKKKIWNRGPPTHPLTGAPREPQQDPQFHMLAIPPTLTGGRMVRARLDSRCVAAIY